jgi:chromosomal replication initiation ATPase DnaA
METKTKNKKREPIYKKTEYVSPYSFAITKQAKKPKDTEAIVRSCVLKAFGTDWNTINVKGRQSGLLMPRHAYFYFMRRINDSAEYPLSRIGAIMGRGHATVINSIRVWENLIETSIAFSEIHDEIKESIGKRLNNINTEYDDNHLETIANWDKFKRKYECNAC